MSTLHSKKAAILSVQTRVIIKGSYLMLIQLYSDIVTATRSMDELCTITKKLKNLLLKKVKRSK